ncbi:RabGAP/TBC, partial [Martensiomyces pterosporus]
ELEMLRGLVAKGVPEQFRRQVWMECSGALDMAQDEEKRGLVSDQDKEEIELDLLRTAAETHPLAQDEHSIDRLRSVLCAYASLNPDVGYCQGMNKIAFGLLSAGLDPDDALALLRCLLDGGILPADLFKPPMLTLQADQLVLEELVSRCLPELAEHLSVRLEGSVPLAPVTVSWFLTLFADYLPEPMRLRVWDVLFADGYEAVFQACLAILKLCEPTLLHCDTPVAMYTVLQDVRSMMDH